MDIRKFYDFPNRTIEEFEMENVKLKSSNQNMTFLVIGLAVVVIGILAYTIQQREVVRFVKKVEGNTQEKGNALQNNT